MAKESCIQAIAQHGEHDPHTGIFSSCTSLCGYIALMVGQDSDPFPCMKMCYFVVGATKFLEPRQI